MHQLLEKVSLTRWKNIKNVTKCRESRSAKSTCRKQGRDDSIKQFSIRPHPTYLLSLCNYGKRCLMGSCIVTCFMLSSLPCFPAFCWSAIPSLYSWCFFFGLSHTIIGKRCKMCKQLSQWMQPSFLNSHTLQNLQLHKPQYYTTTLNLSWMLFHTESESHVLMSFTGREVRCFEAAHECPDWCWPLWHFAHPQEDSLAHLPVTQQQLHTSKLQEWQETFGHY